jgi:NET1-associated nuclear protein 1 (U3 small nucleolar RNA-associated protein 17)
MTVASMDSAGNRRDVIFTTEKYEERWRISAHELSFMGSSTTTLSRIVYTSPQKIQILKALDEGAVIVAASEDRVLLGSLRSTEFGTVDKIRYEFRIFESSDIVSSLDARVSKRNSGTKLDKVKVVDVVVGDVKGSIFVHNDLIGNLIESQKSAPDGQHLISLIPRKLHWHRKAVHCVKWSLDGPSYFM